MGLVFEIVICVLIAAALGYFAWQNHKHFGELQASHEKAMAKIAEVATAAMENVKATSLAEREQVRAQRAANDVQIEHMRDIIKKQSDMITSAPTKPEKVKLEDGTEVDASEYEWGYGV